LPDVQARTDMGALVGVVVGAGLLLIWLALSD